MSAAVYGRSVAADLLEAGVPPRGLLAGNGFNGEAFIAFWGPRASPYRARRQSPTRDHANDPTATAFKKISD